MTEAEWPACEDAERLLEFLGARHTSTNCGSSPPIGHDRDRDRDRRNVRFEVQVRHRGHWDTYGAYRDRDDAQRVVRMLERRGQDARIEVERGRW